MSSDSPKAGDASSWHLTADSGDLLFLAEKGDARVYAIRHGDTVLYIEDTPVSYKRRAFHADMIKDPVPVLHALVRSGWDVQINHLEPG